MLQSLWGLSYTYGPVWGLSYTYDRPLWGLSYTYGPVWGLSYTYGAVYSCVWTKLRNILKQPPQVFSKKAVYENFANFCKTSVPESLFYNQACHFIKKTLWHRCLPVSFAKFLTRTFFSEHRRMTASETYWLHPVYSCIYLSNAVPEKVLFEAGL